MCLVGGYVHINEVHNSLFSNTVVSSIFFFFCYLSTGNTAPPKEVLSLAERKIAASSHSNHSEITLISPPPLFICLSIFFQVLLYFCVCRKKIGTFHLHEFLFTLYSFNFHNILLYVKLLEHGSDLRCLINVHTKITLSPTPSFSLVWKGVCFFNYFYK